MDGVNHIVLGQEELDRTCESIEVRLRLLETALIRRLCP
jgi:hypothetical protein